MKGIQLLAETEGIFTETAGGVTTGVTQKLLQQGYIHPSETTVACITGNGLKTIDAISQEYTLTPAIEPRLTLCKTPVVLAAIRGKRRRRLPSERGARYDSSTFSVVSTVCEWLTMP